MEHPNIIAAASPGKGAGAKNPPAGGKIGTNQNAQEKKGVGTHDPICCQIEIALELFDRGLGSGAEDAVYCNPGTNRIRQIVKEALQQLYVGALIPRMRFRLPR